MGTLERFNVKNYLILSAPEYKIPLYMVSCLDIAHRTIMIMIRKVCGHHGPFVWNLENGKG